MSEDKQWTNEDLITYISLFRDKERENVLKQILECDLLEKFLGTTGGRLILGYVVDEITANTMNIVRLAAENPTENVTKIGAAALQISILYDFMYKIADMAIKGESHKKEITRKKKSTTTR